jgi:hypothetical protein
MPIKTIEDHLYMVRIHFVHNEPVDKAYKFVEKKGNLCSKETFEEHFKVASGFVFWAAKQDIFLILIDDKNIGTLAHEVFHVVDNVFRDKGLKLTEESCEAYAYYIGKLTHDLVNFMNQQYISKQKKAKKKR